MASGTFTPYSTGADYFGTKPTWIPDELDIQRILSYQTYEQLYWNVPDVLKISLRGTNTLPLYVPAARTVIDTTNRYYGVDLRVVCSGTGVDVTAAEIALKDLFKREKVRSKFNGQKRYGLIQGDQITHVTADESKPVGQRIRITALDPGMYFPIPDEDDVDRIVGCHLVELIVTSDGERIRRLTYRKTDNGRITVEEGVFAVDKWGGPEAIPERVVKPPTELPEQITSIPVYHTKNTETPGDPFGSSEVRGLERLFGGLNQAMSDEDLALAMIGIGMYATDASQPIDPKSKQPVPWKLGPGRVIHHDGTSFTKMPGATDLDEVYGAHYNRLWEAIKQAASTPDVAIGSVDVQIAQSGIALALQLSPMLSKAGEKNDLLLDTQNQLWYDVMNMWMPAYEQTTFEGVTYDCAVSNGVPVDREARFTELNDMLDRGVIDTEYYREEVKKLGYVFPEGMGARATAEWEKRQAMSDGFADRVDEELGASGGGTESE
ncbi:MAG: hypothetical protein ABW022_11015 [Actinoplanes sp.]